ncbi:WD repeat-containing protein 18 [Trematomus bernacchii]|uniref:WD repeat-containing protein 18 n=1 Tax=Pagothenia borchgrevinki TaxID=8213 RepID=A0ABD2G1W2_PAGBO|nr:WD repeat-containing protein 18 [Trematomus bernacchii]
MAAPLEVIVSSDSGSQMWNSTVFDLLSGSSLLSYRGGSSSARGLTLLSGGYLLCAQLGKNFINVWEIQRKDQLQQKIVCPGVITCLTASPDGLFLAAGVAEGIYLWEVSTGKLLSVLNRHYQDVTCLKFTDDSSHFISGGKDNMALVWSLCSVIQLDLNAPPEPRHILSRHSLPITDLHCGLMGAQARVATASLDQTVKVWELSSGELLLSVLFDVEIMSVTFDPSEYFLFCGGSDGNIFQVSLCSQSLSREKSFQSDSDGDTTFKGHRNLVTCLSVSMDGTLLLSGSHDETVRLWDIQSKQSIRSLAHKGPVTNAVIMAAPANMFLPDSRPAVPLPRFSRHLQASEGGGASEVCVRPALYTQEEELTYMQKADMLNLLMNAVTDKSVYGDGENTKVRVSELEEEVQTLKKVNKDLYEFTSQLLTKPT